MLVEIPEVAGDIVLEDLARKIRSQREKRGLKQQDIANALRLSPQAVSKWERGENAPDLSVLAPLANLLGVTTDWLLSTTEGHPDVFEATVLVSSVEGAYGKSRTMKPRDFATWANGLFYTLTEVTLRQGAVPIKYMGDQYLCFFTGPRHQARALEAAMDAVNMIADDLKVALGSGEIYLGAMGHPDYSRPDITGEAVNVTFLTHEWAEGNATSSVTATRDVMEGSEANGMIAREEEVSFRGVAAPVVICEVNMKAR